MFARCTGADRRCAVASLIRRTETALSNRRCHPLDSTFTGARRHRADGACGLGICTGVSGLPGRDPPHRLSAARRSGAGGQVRALQGKGGSHPKELAKGEAEGTAGAAGRRGTADPEEVSAEVPGGAGAAEHAGAAVDQRRHQLPLPAAQKSCPTGSRPTPCGTPSSTRACATGPARRPWRKSAAMKIRP